MASHSTVVDTVTHALSLQILDGTLVAGARLPSVRALADSHGVNVSTIQRVLTRLQERRLVRAHDRSGIEVCDVRRSGGASLWPLVLERCAVDPGPALALLNDALATRRLLAVQVLEGIREHDYAEYGPGLHARIADLEAIVAGPESTCEQLAEADGEVLRTLLLAAQRPALLAIFNDVQTMIVQTPALVEAFFRDPQTTLGAWQSLDRMLAADLVDDAAIGGIQTLLKTVDEGIIAAFERSTGAQT
ncbi:MAG: GntR family transcriptional regulator [Myxococcota bacterium]